MLPAILQIVGFGLLLGRDAASVATVALFGFIGLLWGGTLGSGIASSRDVREPGLGRATETATTTLS